MRYDRMILLMILAIGLVQCNTKDSNYRNYLHANFTNSLDIRALIGDDRPIIDIIIKNGKALLTVTTEPGKGHDSTFYIVLDIAKKQQIGAVVSPVAYIESRVDINGDSLFCVSAFKPECMHVINIKTGQVNERTVKNSTSSLPGDLVAFDQFVVLTNGLYNTAIVNRASGEVRMFENDFITNQHAVSCPLNSSINLITGNSFGGDSIRFIALDQRGAAIWESKIKIRDDLRNNVWPLDILRTGTSFIVRNSSELQALDAETGKLLWNKNFQPYTTQALPWNNKVILVTLVAKEMTNNGYRQQMALHLVEPATGEVLWSKNYEVTGYVKYVPVNDKLFVTTYKSLKVFNIHGEIVTDTALENKHTSIEAELDKITGKSYLLLNGETLYW
jgi:outer membrane protein assembly factor BamB